MTDTTQLFKTLEDNLLFTLEQLEMGKMDKSDLNAHFHSSDFHFQLLSIENLLQEQVETLEASRLTFNQVHQKFDVLMKKMLKELSCEKTVECKEKFLLFFTRTISKKIRDPKVYQSISEKHLNDWYVLMNNESNKLNHYNEIPALIANFHLMYNNYVKIINLINSSVDKYKNSSNYLVRQYVNDLLEQSYKMSNIQNNVLQAITALDIMDNTYKVATQQANEAMMFILGVKQAKTINVFDTLVNAYQKLENIK